MRPPPTLPITLAGFAAFLDLYATQPLLPLLAKTFHASTFEVGLTVTAPTVAVAIAAPIIGRVADRFGLRRVILGSACALTVTTVMAATSGSLHQLIAWRFVQGLATPGIFASAIAYVHEVWPPDRAGRGTAMYMSGTVVGGFTGRLVAGLTAAAFSWSMSFVALAAFNALIAAALFFWLPSEKRHVKVSSPATRGGLGHLLANRRLVATCGVGFTVLFTQVAMFTYVTFHLAAPPFELSTQALGWLFVVYLVGAVVTPISGRWIDIYGHRAGLGSAMALGAAGALLTLAPSLPAIVAGLALVRDRRLRCAGDRHELHRGGHHSGSRRCGGFVFDLLLRRRQHRRGAAVALLECRRLDSLRGPGRRGAERRRRDRAHSVGTRPRAPRPGRVTHCFLCSSCFF